MLTFKGSAQFVKDEHRDLPVKDKDGNVVEIAVPLKDMQEQMLNAAEAQQAEASLEEAEAAAAQADDFHLAT